MPGRKELPSTLERSDKKAQETWIKTHDSAVKTYGEGQSAHRAAFAALKHTYEKKGDRWVKKAHRGPSDPQAARGPTTRIKSTDRRRAPTAGREGGEDAGAGPDEGERSAARVRAGAPQANKEVVALEVMS